MLMTKLVITELRLLSDTHVMIQIKDVGGKKTFALACPLRQIGSSSFHFAELMANSDAPQDGGCVRCLTQLGWGRSRNHRYRKAE
jgi:hypothetical protein